MIQIGPYDMPVINTVPFNTGVVSQNHNVCQFSQRSLSLVGWLMFARLVTRLSTSARCRRLAIGPCAGTGTMPYALRETDADNLSVLGLLVTLEPSCDAVRLWWVLTWTVLC